MEFLRTLFDTSSFPARWNCGDWTAPHGWTHIISDLGIFLAYTSIPIALFWFIFRRKDLFFPAIFWLFGSFILLCGLTHLLEAIIFWEPFYRFSAVIKAMTAVVSWITVIAVVKVLPTALDLPGLKITNDKLRKEVEQRKAAELEAAQAREELENVLFVASHDLREPVRGIVSFSEMLEMEGSEQLDETGKDLLQRVTRSGKHLAQLISGIQEIAHLREDRRQTEMLDSREAIDTALAELDPLIFSSQGTVEISEKLPTLYSNRFWLERIFYNLISNALKYSEEGVPPVVEINSIPEERLEAERVGIIVSDRNATIPKSKREAIFELFRRNSHPGIEGTGAGLAIVRAAAKRYDGKVWHEARKGGGNRFFITFRDKPYRSKKTSSTGHVPSQKPSESSETLPATSPG